MGFVKLSSKQTQPNLVWFLFGQTRPYPSKFGSSKPQFSIIKYIGYIEHLFGTVKNVFELIFFILVLDTTGIWLGHGLHGWTRLWHDWKIFNLKIKKKVENFYRLNSNELIDPEVLGRHLLPLAKTNQILPYLLGFHV